MGNTVKFNTIPIIIPIVVDVKLSMKDCFLVCISNYPNKIHSYPTKYPCLVSFHFENNKLVSQKTEVKDILETLKFIGVVTDAN